MSKATSEKILSAALTLMESKPVSLVTFREIAAEAGISHMAPYRHFKSRLEVFGKLAEEGHEILGGLLNQVIEKFPVDPEKQILTTGLTYYDFSIEYPIHFKLMFMEPLLDKRSDRPESLIKAARSSYEVFLKMIHNAQMKEVISPKLDPREVAFILWSSVHGSTVLCQNLDLSKTVGSIDTRKSIQHAGKAILAGFRTN